MPANDSKHFETEVAAMVRARYPLIYVATYEEPRCLELMERICQEREATLFCWSRTQGITKGEVGVADIVDPLGALKWYDEQKEKSILVLKDFHAYLKEPTVIRKLRDLGQSLKRAPKTIILLSPVVQIPPELAKDISVMEFPLPDRKEIENLIERAVRILPEAGALSAATTAEVVDAATGLTFDEIENVLAKSLVSKGTLDKRLIQDEKKQIVKRSGILEFIESKNENTPEIGGLESLKEWLRVRRGGLGPEARSIGLPAPKGILLVGIPGCGKSLTAMTVGKEWQLPLLRLDMGKIFSGIVGSSEGNVRNAIATCEAVAPCVLWIDEIEKGLSGTQSSGSSDGGTTSRVFGTLLTWMQEKKSAVFVVATANDISQLPPEFLRRGRFDEIFFVDLPTAKEREDILKIHLARFKWEVTSLDLPGLVSRTEGFSGSELEQLIIAARYLAFGQNEIFSQTHLLTTTTEMVPLSRTMGERIDFLRGWAQHRARPASVARVKVAGDRFQQRTDSMELA